MLDLKKTRIQSDFYREPIKPEFFDYAVTHSKAPLVFNGEIKTIKDIENTFSIYPVIDAVMIGRGLIENPELAMKYSKGISEDLSTEIDIERFKKFHNELLEQYIEILSGEKPVLHRLKEFWGYWQQPFAGQEKTIKKIRKSNKISEYKALFEELV